MTGSFHGLLSAKIDMLLITEIKYGARLLHWTNLEKHDISASYILSRVERF